jgi:hypothetical protein
MTAQEPNQPVTLTREELYTQVWSTPMSQLAAQYGITGTGLAKICARHIIPCPPRGYWAKKAADKPVVQYRLPDPQADTLLQVTIAPTPPPVTPTAAQTEIETQIAAAREAHAGLVVPAQLTRPHPIIAESLAEHRRKTQGAKRERDPSMRRLMQPKEFTDSDHRQHRFLDTLFKALERLGFSIKSEQYQPVYLEVQKERVDFQLREKQKQARRPLTEEEKHWHWNGDRGWAQELQPTGMLIFTIKTYLPDGIPHEWKDQPGKPLEKRLPDIVAALSLAGPALVTQRHERVEAEKRRWEEDHRRYLERRRREQDQKRWERFLEFAHQCDQAASARRLLAQLEAQSQPKDVTFGDLSATEGLAWATQWLERFDPLMQKPQELYNRLAEI